ncbi:MAG: hypothetical protein ACLUN9_11090 [Enterocloster aldenensis]
MGKMGKGGLIRPGKRILAKGLWLAAVLWLTSCAQGNGAGITGAGGAEGIGETDGIRQEQQGKQKQQEQQEEAVNGVQLAKGYGIFSAGQAPVYVLKQEPGPIRTQGAEARLLSSVYHDGTLYFLVELKDYSVTEIPKQEAEALLEQQEENPGLVEEGDQLYKNLDYFPIDREQGIYGRSSFEARAGYRSAEEGVQGEYQKEHFTNSISGAGIPGGSFSADRTARIGNYQGFLRNGYVTAYLTYYSDKMKLEIPGPEGSYQIHIPGFEDGFSIEFVKAGQYPGIGDIPGMVIKEGVGIMATGEKTDNGLSVTAYIWTDGTYGATPEVYGLVCETAAEKGRGRKTGFQANRNFYGSSSEFMKRIEGREWTTFFYEIPERFDEGSFFLECGSVSLARQEKSGWMSIPVPEGKEELNQSVELSDCTIQIVSAEKIDRQAWLQKYGTIMEDAEEHYRPCVYLGTKVTMDGQKDMHLKHVRAVQEEEDPQDPTRDRWGRCVYQNGELVGIYAFYEEGDKDLDLRFEGPGYVWHEAFRVPVQLENHG